MPGTLVPDRTKVLINDVLAAAATYVGPETVVPRDVRSLSVQAKFVRAAGGTSCKVYLQTSFDGGVTWVDIACLAFLTTTATKISAVRPYIAMAAAYVPTDATLTDDTIKDGLLGDRLRVKYVVVGTYSGASSLTVTAIPN